MRPIGTMTETEKLWMPVIRRTNKSRLLKRKREKKAVSRQRDYRKIMDQINKNRKKKANEGDTFKNRGPGRRLLLRVRDQ